MQKSESQKYRCPKCAAMPGDPCLTVDGRVAEKVHYGRPNPPGDSHAGAAYRRAVSTLATSPLRPSVSSPGIWVGAEFMGQGLTVPYGAWVCPCGESREVLSREGVDEMNCAYTAHADCRKES